MRWAYSERAIRLFMDAVHGRPGTHLGEIENPDGMGEQGSIVCGDALRFTFRVRRHPDDPRKDVITEARYRTVGCTSAIAASEALCAILEERGCTPLEALRISHADIVRYLGGLPARKIHCSALGTEALQAAVADWAQRRGVRLDTLGRPRNSGGKDEGRIVCKCFSVTEPYLRRQIQALGLRSIPEVTSALKAGGACRSCHRAPGGLQAILNDCWSGASASATSPSAGKGEPFAAVSAAPPKASEAKGASGSPCQRKNEIDRTVESLVRPVLRAEGGDVEIVDIKDDLVYCRLRGAGAGCADAPATLKLMVEHLLKEEVDERIRVIAM